MLNLGTFFIDLVLIKYSQVVAGMNFKIELGIFDGFNCIGGLKSTVFRDLQGVYSVTSYGNEISCDKIHDMLNAKNGKNEQ